MTTTQTQTISVELADAYAAAAKRARTDLGADGAGVVARKLPFGFEVFAADAVRGFDLGATLSAALIDIVHQSSRTLTPTALHSVVLAPIVSEGAVVAVLHVARRSGLGFTAHEVRAVEAIANSLGAAATDEAGAGGRRNTLQRKTIMNLLAGDHDLVDWEEDDDPNGPIVAFSPLLDTSLANAELRSGLTRTLVRVLEVSNAHVAAIVLGVQPITVLAVAATPKAPDLPADRLISKTVVSQVMESGQPMLTLDAPSDGLSAAASIMSLMVTTVMGIPLAAPRHGGTFGVLYSATFNSSAKLSPETIETVMGDARALGPMLAGLTRS